MSQQISLNDLHAEAALPKNAKESLRGFTLKCFIFSIFTSSAVIVSYFPIYFDAKGFSKVQIGWLYSIGPFMGIFANLFWGLTADRLQTIKKVLMFILASQLCLSVLLTQTESFTLLVILMMLFFFFQTPTNSLQDSLTLLTVKANGKSYASYRAWGSIGFAASALGFGFLFDRISPAYIMFTCCLTVTSSFVFSLTVKDRKGSAKKMQFSGLWQVLKSRELLKFLFVVLLMSIAHRINDGFLAVYLHELGASPSIIGWSWTLSSVSEIPVIFLLSKFGNKFKELPLLAVASLFYAIRFFLMSNVDNPHWIVAIQAMHSVTFGIYLVTAIRYIGRLVPDEYRATGQALLAITFSGCAGLISGTAGGWIYEHWNAHVLYMTGAVLALLACAGFLRIHVQNSRLN